MTGNYKTKQTYSYDDLYQLIKVSGETTYNPYRSSVPEFVSNYSQLFEFDTDGLGNMTSKVSSETVTPHKTIGDNLNYSFNYVYDENFAHRLVRAGDRYYKYDANGNIVCEQDGSFESNGEEVSYHKITQETDGVYSTDYGWGLFKEDDKGGSGKANRTKYKRTYKWNERNQLVSSVDDNYSTAYIYGQDGQRANKYTQNSETLYFNKMWTLHTDSGNNVYGGQTAKNIYLGETRIVTKLNSGTNPTYQEEYYKQYYYHSDHLGSASLISDYKGDEYQRIEYTPYGETWVEKTSNTGLEWLPYKFTAKELDEETGLYYYGARYLDPKYSRWITCDPALGKYIPSLNSDISKLPAGGIFESLNLSVYHYAKNNPINYTDPTGLFDKKQFFWASVQTFGGIVEVAAGILAEGVSAGTSTYAVIDGIYNIADGVIGMVAAACDKKYDGAIPEVAAAIAEKKGATKEQQEAVAAWAGLADAIIDAKATAGLSLVSKGKTANALVKGVKAVDKANDIAGKASLGKQSYDTAKETFDVVKESVGNNSVKNTQDEKQNVGVE